MVNNKIVLKYAMKNDHKQDLFHSSGYGKSQSGANFGTAGATSFEKRKDIEEKRKFVQGYKNSRIMNGFYGVERAKMLTRRDGNRNGGRSGDGDMVSGNSENGTRRSGNGRDTEMANPMDVAMRRAKFSASNGRRAELHKGNGALRAGSAGVKQVLPAAKAPSIPTRRSGV